MEHIIDRLIADIKKKNSVVCVGLDPMNESADNLFTFGKNIIDLTHDLAVAFKPQIAYYEQHGGQGLDAFIRTVEYAHSKGVIVIDDAKRGDIGSTAQAYAHGHFDTLGADLMTLSPYAGADGLAPFLKYSDKGKGTFIWACSSSTVASEMPNMVLEGGDSVCVALAKLIRTWGEPYIGQSGYSSVGAVVGATHPEKAAQLRTLMPKSFWLVPGYGAQGGTAETAKACFNADGLGAIVSSSRGIIYAKDPRAAAIEMRNALNKVRTMPSNV